jgi:hypothetical protein
MNHGQILKRAWNILWSYRALWIFGIILAITSPSPSFSRPRAEYSGRPETRGFQITPPGEITREFEKLGKLFSEGVPAATRDTIIPLVIGLVCAGLLLFILFRIGYYISQVALLRMVNGYEETGEKVSWKEGFRLGWSRAAWHLFLIDLVVYVPVMLGFTILFGFAALPVLLGIGAGNEPTIPGIIATVGLVFLVIFLAVAVGVTLSLIMNIIRRICVFQNAGVRESILHGWQMVCHNLKDVFLMWLLMIGVCIGFMIAIIPVVLLLVGVGILVGGGIGLAIYALIQASSATSAWITAIILGGGVFLLVLALPLLFLGGLREIFISTSWTLTYRELKPAEPQDSGLLPETGTETATSEPV